MIKINVDYPLVFDPSHVKGNKVDDLVKYMDQILEQPGRIMDLWEIGFLEYMETIDLC